MSTSTAVDQWQQAHSQLSSEAQERFAVDEVRTIRNTVAPDLNPSEFQMFMNLAAKYDLDPLAKEIWGAKGRSKNGQPGRVLIMVGRDGLLKVARRDKTYAGFDSDVVRKGDVFRVDRSKEGREIIHNYEGSVEDRGEIVGAWAQVYQKGYHDTYFYAPWGEYAPSNPDSRSPWAKQPSVMIQKCALALCLRLAFNLSGVLAEEEAARVFEEDASTEGPSLHEVLHGEGGVEDEELRERLLQAVLDARNVRPGIVSDAAVQMSVAGQTREAVQAYVERMEEENARAAAEGAPVDAEVVEGDEVPAPAPQEDVDVEALRARLSSLLDQRTNVEENPGDQRETEAELARLDGEIDEVEGQLREAGGSVPGQSHLEV